MTLSREVLGARLCPIFRLAIGVFASAALLAGVVDGVQVARRRSLKLATEQTGDRP